MNAAIFLAAWTLYGGLGGGAVIGEHDSQQGSPPFIVPHPGHGSGAEGAIPAAALVGNLNLVWSKWRMVGLEAYGDNGFGGGDYWLRLGIGARIENRSAKVRPYFSARAVHIHMAPWETWKKHPIAAYAGASSVGLEHRSGLSTAVGISTPVMKKVRAYTSLELMWIPIGNGPDTFVIGTAGLGWSF